MSDLKQQVLDIPTFLLRGHPDCIVTKHRRVSTELNIRAPKSISKRAKKRAAVDEPVVQSLRKLGWSLAAIRKMSRTRGHKLAYNRIEPGKEHLLDYLP